MKFIFVTGTGRCGTNIIRGLLDGHTDINVLPGEINLIKQLQTYDFLNSKKLSQNYIVSNFLNQINVNDKLKNKFKSKIFSILKKNKKKNFFKDIITICNVLFKKKKKYILINTQNESISDLIEIFKDCKILHMIRNPLTQINSRYLFRYYSVAKNFSGDEFTNAFKRNFISFEQVNLFERDKCVKIIKMEDLRKKPEIVMTKITKFLKINIIKNFELTEMGGKFKSTLNGKIIETKNINKNIETNFSNLLPNDLYYCSLITPAKKFYKISNYKKKKNSFILYLIRHYGLIGANREYTYNPILIIKRFIYTLHNYINDINGKNQFLSFLKNISN